MLDICVTVTYHTETMLINEPKWRLIIASLKHPLKSCSLVENRATIVRAGRKNISLLLKWGIKIWVENFFSLIFLWFTFYITVPPTLCTIFTILLTLWNSEQKNGLLLKLFCFSSDFDETWWSCVLQFHQVSSKLDEKQKKF